MESGEQVSSSKLEKKSASVSGFIGGAKIGILFSSGKILSFTTRK